MKARFEHLDGLRGLAALNVMLGHGVLAFDYALYTGNPGESHAGWDVPLSAFPLLLPIAGQNFSVAIFLVMSGFVLAHAFGASALGAPALAAKRFTRLALPILAATVFAWALLAAGLMFHQAAVPFTQSAWLGQQLAHTASLPSALTEGLFGAMLGPWSYAASYDSSLWTMSIEFAGSMLLIGAFTARRRFGDAGQNRRLGAGVLALIGAILYPTYVSLILVGAAICLLDLQRVRLPGSLCVGLGTLAVLMGTVPCSAARGAFWDSLVALVPGQAVPVPFDRLGPGAARMDAPAIWHGFGAVLLLMVVECSPTLRGLLADRRTRFLGLISFPLYVVHVPVLLSVGCGVFLLLNAAGLPYAVAACAAVLCYAVIALGLASVAARFVERPAIRAANQAGRAIEHFARRTRPPKPFPPFPATLPTEPAA